MKKIILLITLFSACITIAQTKYLTKVGEVTFEASVSSFEEVKATNKNTTAIINSDTGEFASLVLVKGFRFKNALMEEHFNENYAESDDFPKAKFKGKITDFSATNTSSTYTGTLTFHGKSITLTNQPITVTSEDNTLGLKGDFVVNVSDFDIEIPSVVSKKLAKKVTVYFDFTMNKK